MSLTHQENFSVAIRRMSWSVKDQENKFRRLLKCSIKCTLLQRYASPNMERNHIESEKGQKGF